jgi:hypothetical protein
MARVRRIADVGSDRIVAMLILKYAIQDEELLTASMHVRRETAFRRVSNDGRGTGHFLADSIEHTSFDARDR